MCECRRGSALKSPCCRDAGDGCWVSPAVLRFPSSCRGPEHLISFASCFCLFLLCEGGTRGWQRESEPLFPLPFSLQVLRSHQLQRGPVLPEDSPTDVLCIPNSPQSEGSTHSRCQGTHGNFSKEPGLKVASHSHVSYLYEADTNSPIGVAH